MDHALSRRGTGAPNDARAAAADPESLTSKGPLLDSDQVLPPFIIEQIRRREEREKAQREEQPRLELPLERPRPVRSRDDDEPDPDRGVLIVDLG